MKHFLRYFLLFFSVLLLSTSFVDTDTIVRKAGAKVKMTEKYRKELLASGGKEDYTGYYSIYLNTYYQPDKWKKPGQEEEHDNGIRNGEMQLLKDSDVIYLKWVQDVERRYNSGNLVILVEDFLYYLPFSEIPESTVSPKLMTNKGACCFISQGWETNGYTSLPDFLWSGDISDGFIDGSGEGYLLQNVQNGKLNYYDLFFVKGTFKRGRPAGQCFYRVMRVGYSPWTNVIKVENSKEMDNLEQFFDSKIIYYDQATDRCQICKNKWGSFLFKYDLDDSGKIAGPSEESLKELESYADSYLSILTDEYSVENLKLYENQSKKSISSSVNGMDLGDLLSARNLLKEYQPDDSPLMQKIIACETLKELYLWFSLPEYGINYIIQWMEKAANTMQLQYAVQKVEEQYDYYLKHSFLTDYEELLKSPLFSRRDDKITEAYVRAFIDRKNERVEEAHKKYLALAQQSVDYYYQKHRSSTEENNYSHNVIDVNSCRKPRGELVQSFLSSIWRHLNDGYIYFKNEKQDSYYSVKYNILYNKDKSFNCYTITGAFFPVAGDFSSYSEMIDAIEKAYAKYKQR